jgi:3-keto-disaccharide hydrolase
MKLWKVALLGALVMVSLTAVNMVNAADAPKADANGWYTLFNGESLDGWKFSDEPGSFVLEDGAIKVAGNRSHLYYVGPVNEHDFTDFEFEADVMTKPGANSGVYIHTRYQKTRWPDWGHEVQVNQTQGDRVKTGSLYDIKDALNLEMPVKDNEWFKLRIVVEGKNIKTFVNGKPIIDWTESEDYKPAKHHSGRFVGHGTFCLQAHDPGSVIYYKNIRVKPNDKK